MKEKGNKTLSSFTLSLSLARQPDYAPEKRQGFPYMQMLFTKSCSPVNSGLGRSNELWKLLWNSGNVPEVAKWAQTIWRIPAQGMVSQCSGRSLQPCTGSHRQFGRSGRNQRPPLLRHYTTALGQKKNNSPPACQSACLLVWPSAVV